MSVIWLKIISIPCRLMLFSWNCASCWWDWESGALSHSEGGALVEQTIYGSVTLQLT